MPAPTKFQKPTATRNITAQRCGNGVCRSRLLRGAELQERPRLDGQEGERDHLGRREERAERHVLGRLAGEVQVVHRADDAADGVEDDVEEDHRERDPLAHHPEQHEHVGDHHRGEQLEEVLDPEVHHPEAPELGGREVVAGAREQADRVERRDGAGGEEEQPGHVAPVLALQPHAQDAVEHEHPDEQADREQDLPEPGQVQVLEALEPEPVGGGVLEHAVHAEEGPDQRADHHDGQRPQQREGELALMLRLAPGDHRGQEDPRRDERGGDPEERELDVPGAHEVVGEDLRQVEAEEAVDLRPVVLRGRPDEGLNQEQGGHHEEEPGRGPLRRSQRHLARAGGTRASPARGRASRACCPSARRPRTAGRSHRAARSATAPTRRPRSPSACCPRVAPAASCSCTSSCGPDGWWRPPTRSSAKKDVSCFRVGAVGDRVGTQAVLACPGRRRNGCSGRPASGTHPPGARSA